MMLRTSAAAPTEHKNQVKHTGRWLKQPNLSRYSERNIFPTPLGLRRALLTRPAS